MKDKSFDNNHDLFPEEKKNVNPIDIDSVGTEK
jgi:hypothetical protein